MLRTSGGRLLFVLSFLGVLFIAGCGSGTQTVSPGPQGFTNSSLTGTYAFAISGTSNVTGNFFAIAGSFQANGSGTITGGTEDVNIPGTGGVLLTNTPITGTYVVRSDGRTTATITESATNPAISFNIDMVLLNTSSGLAIQFQSNGTGSGSVDLQNSSAFNLASLSGPLAFTLSGVDSANSPESNAGLLNIDSSGDIVAGSVIDDNDSGSVTLNQPIPIAALAVTAPTTGNGRGTLQIGGTANFAYYVVDANHLKLVEIDGGVNTPFLSGDAFRQTSSAISGNFAFTLAGATSAGNNIFTAGGILVTDGAGHVTNSSVTDVNNGGSFFQAISTTGTYTVSGGRGTMTLTGSFGTLNLAVYPSTGGLLMVEVDTSILSTGTGLQQSGTFSNATLNGGYGLNLTGANANGEVDGIAQFNTTGTGTLSGAFDFNQAGLLSNSLALNGTYNISANGRGTGTLNPSSLGTFNVIYYVASGSRVLFMEPDSNQVTVGVFAAQ